MHVNRDYPPGITRGITPALPGYNYLFLRSRHRKPQAPKAAMTALFAAAAFGLILHGAASPTREAPVAAVINSADKKLVERVSEALSASFSVQNISESGLASGAASKADVLVLPSVNHLSDAALASYEQYARGGGVLWTLGSGRPPRVKRGVNLSMYTLDIMSTYEPYQLGNQGRPGGAVRMLTVEGQSILNQSLDIQASGFGKKYLSGLSALTFTSPEQATLVPLLETFDIFNRSVGWGASLTVFSQGPFAGGRWLVTGVNAPALLDKKLLSALAGVVRACVKNPDSVSRAVAAYRSAAASASRKSLLRDALRFGGHGGGSLEPLTRSADHVHFVHKADPKRRFFAVGANYFRSATGVCNPDAFESDIARAAAAGLNALRIFGYGSTLENSTWLAAIHAAADRYGVYMLPDLDCYKDPVQNTSQGVKSRTAAQAGTVKGEPWVLGLDLCNEPNNEFDKIAGIYVNSTARLVDVYPYTSRDKTLKDLVAWLCGTWDTSFSLCQAKVLERGGPLVENEVPEDLRPVFNDVQGILETWIGWKVGAIRSVANDSDILLTVGHNAFFGMWPANEQLDFVAHHVYPKNQWNNKSCMYNAPGNVTAVPTTLDRLKVMWGAETKSPAGPRPVVMGEFGLRTTPGLWLMNDDGEQAAKGEADDGDNMCDSVSFDAGAAWDAMMWFRALAVNTEGALRWSLTDQPYVLNVQKFQYIGNDSTPMGHQANLAENRFGMYWYDGTPNLRPKQIVFVSRFLAHYTSRGTTWQEQSESRTYSFNTTESPGCELSIAWEFRGSDVLAVGGGCSTTSVEGLSRTPLLGGASTSVVMMTWDQAALNITASSDVVVSLDPSVFVDDVSADSAAVVGPAINVTRSQSRICFTLLRGDWICVGKDETACAGISLYGN